ncbi:MAG TPA: hypothetical protein PKD88_08300 [Nitrosomonas sp.]|nr:hypothetical protein [Nitrosomonas sp.]HMW20995.1 hypothetical protein [Nitrosomonas sp.]HMW69895.1 hypothetical protein [Nitrosomonas sp.]HMY62175.1 hypothetical protein [Nitrosomonas sp.]HMY91345.1 hypothetical protein [Nitrosomonas sp.]
MLSGVKADPSANLQQGETGRTCEELSELSGVSSRNIYKVKNIISTGSDELIETVRAGEISINVAEDIATLPQEGQKEIDLTDTSLNRVIVRSGRDYYN